MKNLYEDESVIVYQNGSGEIFVQPRCDKDATIRISPYARRGLSVTCSQGLLLPSSINGLGAFLAVGRQFGK